MGANTGSAAIVIGAVAFVALAIIAIMGPW